MIRVKKGDVSGFTKPDKSIVVVEREFYSYQKPSRYWRETKYYGSNVAKQNRLSIEEKRREYSDSICLKPKTWGLAH